MSEPKISLPTLKIPSNTPGAAWAAAVVPVAASAAASPLPKVAA